MKKYYDIFVGNDKETAQLKYHGEDFASAIRTFTDLAHKAFILTDPPKVQLFYGGAIYPLMAYDPTGLAVETIR